MSNAGNRLDKTPEEPVNALTVDVEDYYHVMAFERIIDPSEWDRMPSRIQETVPRILDLFEDRGVRGTFFVLGWVAERNTSLVKEIAKRGHEIASHGYGHRAVFRIGPGGFREDLRRSIRLLQDLIGKAVHGYRAPSYSITRDSLWAFDILKEEGITYDSSLFPIHHDLGGFPGAARFPHRFEWNGGSIVEFPFSTVKIGPLVLPVAGGGYMRLVPASATILGIRRIHNVEGHPALVYFHPWEIDPDQMRVRCSLRSRFRHYQNLRSTYSKLQAVITAFRFAPMKEVLEGKWETLPSIRV